MTQSEDGPVLTAKANDPECHCQGQPCIQCGDDAKFPQDRGGHYGEGALSDLFETSDKEPVGVLARFIQGSK